mmetsp:Transcript_19625/g.29173  ORF Transcript_19625/g.29173 Transcript_19625/m.29173 type:complete len:83 (-) Transcript_19625:14-262(-)
MTSLGVAFTATVPLLCLCQPTTVRLPAVAILFIVEKAAVHRISHEAADINNHNTRLLSRPNNVICYRKDGMGDDDDDAIMSL